MQVRREALLRFAAWSVFVCAALLCARAARAREWYVSKTGSNADGQSWATAYTSVQTGINAASAGDEVWVAAGTYVVQIFMKDNVAVYGGFAGGESSRDERNWKTNTTTIDGVGVVDRLVRGASHARLDGFTVTGATYRGIIIDISEDKTDLTIANCIVSGNGDGGPGGGIFVWARALTVTDCVISDNVGGVGAGLLCMGYGDGTLTVSGCSFISNAATNMNGAMDIYGAFATITNCTFAFNSAGTWGGGVHCSNSNTRITNCSFYGNTSGYGGAIHNERAVTMITNCTLWGNTASIEGDEIYDADGECQAIVSYSCVAGGWKGIGNFDADPLYLDAPAGDLGLQAGSPCIDGADGDAAPDFDRDGNPRRSDPGIPDRGVGTPKYADIGALEFQGTSAGKWLDVLAPAPGVPVGTGKTFNVQWSSSSETARVKIELSRDGGTKWEPLAGPITNQGSYSWPVTQGASALPQPGCLLRVTDWSDPGTTGTSQPFLIFSGIWYVDDDASAGGDGFTWSSAFQNPQDAADAAYPGQEIWVAGGTYLRRSVDDPHVLMLGNDLAVYGGFPGTPGTEGLRATRDWNLHPTVLDAGGICECGARLTDGVIFDGFTLTNAFGFWGRGLHIRSAAHSRIANCRFVGNVGDNGGGVWCFGSYAEMANCEFIGNRFGNWGAGLFAWTSSAVAINCTFTGNVASDGTGGVRGAFNSSVTLINCILWANSGTEGPEIYAYDPGSTFVVINSCVGQAGYAGVDGNINADPLFVDLGYWIDNPPAGDSSNDTWVDGDYHLQAGSPCIDAANGSLAPATDIEGNPRDDDPAVPNTGAGVPDCADIGAYERQTGHPWVPPWPDIPHPLANDGSGCTSGAGGTCAAGWALAAIVALAVLALRRPRAADGAPG